MMKPCRTPLPIALLLLFSCHQRPAVTAHRDTTASAASDTTQVAKDLTSLSLGEFYFGISPDFDYGSYFLFRNNPAMTNARKWSQFSFYTHNY
ncbi:MAG TPA: hypothetical protein VGS79_02620 [Puia sp.]|nr:hypothetical protein [Puia sp.]